MSIEIYMNLNYVPVHLIIACKMTKFKVKRQRLRYLSMLVRQKKTEYLKHTLQPFKNVTISKPTQKPNPINGVCICA